MSRADETHGCVFGTASKNRRAKKKVISCERGTHFFWMAPLARNRIGSSARRPGAKVAFSLGFLMFSAAFDWPMFRKHCFLLHFVSLYAVGGPGLVQPGLAALGPRRSTSDRRGDYSSDKTRYKMSLRPFRADGTRAELFCTVFYQQIIAPICAIRTALGPPILRTRARLHR